MNYNNIKNELILAQTDINRCVFALPELQNSHISAPKNYILQHLGDLELRLQKVKNMMLMTELKNIKIE